MEIKDNLEKVSAIMLSIISLRPIMMGTTAEEAMYA
jgi:hypothetical protein